MRFGSVEWPYECGVGGGMRLVMDVRSTLVVILVAWGLLACGGELGKGAPSIIEPAHDGGRAMHLQQGPDSLRDPGFLGCCGPILVGEREFSLRGATLAVMLGRRATRGPAMGQGARGHP